MEKPIYQRTSPSINGTVQLCLKLQFTLTRLGVRRLSQQYLKGKKPSPFHALVSSPSGNKDETITFAIDQLRLLRNCVCHKPNPTLGLAEFKDLINLSKDAFTACGFSIVRIDVITCLGETDFPTEQVNVLNDRMKIELQQINMLLQDKICCFIDEFHDLNNGKLLLLYAIQFNSGLVYRLTVHENFSSQP